jgi:hypothetical protein
MSTVSTMAILPLEILYEIKVVRYVSLILRSQVWTISARASKPAMSLGGSAPTFVWKSLSKAKTITYT